MPPLCKGRWHFREKMTEGLFLLESLFLQSLRLAIARHLPLHKGGFFLLPQSNIIKTLLNIFTNRKKCDIMNLRNKPNMAFRSIFLRRDTLPFCVRKDLNLEKSTSSVFADVDYSPICQRFVSQQ